MLNQKALDYIFDVNTKIDTKLSRHFTKLNRFHRDMERVYWRIHHTPQCISRKEQVSPAMRALCTPRRTTWDGMASIGTADSVTKSTQPSKQPARRPIGFQQWEE